MSVSLEIRSTQPVEQNAAVVSQVQRSLAAGPRIESCEFEQLLQRAMEILNARDLKAQLKTAPGSDA
jgi:hypothetical protein